MVSAAKEHLERCNSQPESASSRKKKTAHVKKIKKNVSFNVCHNSFDFGMQKQLTSQHNKMLTSLQKSMRQKGEQDNKNSASKKCKAKNVPKKNKV